MQAFLALLVVVTVAQRSPFDDYLRVVDPCRPNKCTPPQICIRMKCDSGMCAQCTMTTFSTNPDDDLPGFGSVTPPSVAQSVAAPTPAMPWPIAPTPAMPWPGAPTPFVSVLTPRPPSPTPVPLPPALVPRNSAPPSPQFQPASYPYVDPPDPSLAPQLVARPGTLTLTPRLPTASPDPSGSQDPFMNSPQPQLTPRNPSPASSAANPGTPLLTDPCGPRVSCSDCTKDGMCGWDRNRCVVRCAVACIRDSTRCPVDTSCNSPSCSECINSGCVWSANTCQTSCLSAPCIGTSSSCPALANLCAARTCAECANAGCAWSLNGCQSQCTGSACVLQSSRCPRSDSVDTCSQYKTCSECTSSSCKWSMNTCSIACQRNQEDNIICWDAVSMCPGSCVVCNTPVPSCPFGCLNCQQLGQTCNSCAKAVCMDTPAVSLSQGCAIGLPCDVCSASGCTWTVSTGCIPCQSPPCSSSCAPASSVVASTSQTPAMCANDGQCPALQFCTLGSCQPYATTGSACSLTGSRRCLPPAQCVYIGNPFKPENANLNLLYCVKPGQDMSVLLNQLQQQAQAQLQPQVSMPQLQAQPQALAPQERQQQQYQQYQTQQAQQQYQTQQLLMLQPQLLPTPSSPCCQNRSRPGCPSDLALQSCVCELDNFCCATMWDGGCAELATRACGIQCQPQCDGQTCGECVSSGCRWVVPPDGSGRCARNCSAQFGMTCHTSSCPDPCLSSPCPYGQQCSISDACAKPPCYSCSPSQSAIKPGGCPTIGDCDVDYDSSDCSVDDQCEGSSKCCLQPMSEGFVIQPSVRSFGIPRKASNASVARRAAGSSCQWRCMLPNVQCETTGDCGLGQYCSNSQCTDFLDEGMPCSTRSRCRIPLSCTQGLCGRAELSQASSQPSCKGDEECGPEMFCQEQVRQPSVCQPLRTEGLTCGEQQPAWRCAQSLVCLSEGVCRSPDYCSADTDCPQSAECVSSKCAPIKQSCCEENLGATGCTDATVQACVCADDSSCCSVAWDKACAKTAEQKCGAICKSAALWVAPGFGVDPCCGLQKIGGCGDIAVDGNCACKIDNFCCDNTWDYKCINIASQKCGLSCPS